MNLFALLRSGEDPADLRSDRNPYIRILSRLGRLRAPRSQPESEAIRRLRTARLTPGGLPQPPELVGVDADPRTPNQLQPMAGEFIAGNEVNQGRPAFHNPSQRQPGATGSSKGSANYVRNRD